ncbi:MAG: 4a-hydroxytetrahydrobiopterin dehydratase [Anaerolineales bacterium]
MTTLSPAEITQNLGSLPEWVAENGTLTRVWAAPSFSHAVLLFNALAQLAEAAGHHPDFRLFNYNRLEVRLTTHSAGGLTAKDFDLARQMDALPLRVAK